MKKHISYIILAGAILLTLSFSVSAQSLPTITMDKPIKDMTISELQAKIAEILSVIQQLQALIAQLQPGGGGVSCNFYRNLYPGISGSDVKCLQQYLNNTGHTVASSGPGSPNNETIYYGSLTRAAVKKWQDANNIEPGAWWGYFGPKSQAIYNELAATIGEQEEPPTPPSSGTYCGDNIAQRPSDQMIIEDCDGTDTRNKTCITQGYTGGTLSCSNDCSFNTSQCTGTGPDIPTPPEPPTPPGPSTSCGDSIMQTPNSEGIYEVCDRTNLGTSTCLTYGYPGGTLSCSSDCITFNTTNCLTALGGGGGGAPAPEPEPDPGTVCGDTDGICPSGCTYSQDTDCTYCGDNILQRSNDEGILEVCDTTKLNNQTCITKGYTGGTLQCSNTCLTFDTSNCTSPGPENQAPVLNTIGDKTTNENQQLSFTVSAIDIDGDVLSYSIQDRPSGAEFNASTRTFTWTPLYTQSGTYQTTFTVSDGSLTDTETITITVYNVNRAPILNSIGNKTIDENQTLTFIISGTDLDNDTLYYSIQDTPSGASFDSSTKTFTWIPTYEQQGTYTPTFIVSDAEYTDQEIITITVNNVETGPVCGDSICEGTETCSTCSDDCGECAPTEGLISHWKFDGDATDETGTNNGTFIGDAATVYDSERDYSADTNGYVLSLDGDGDYVQVTDTGSLEQVIEGQSITLVAWAKIDGLSVASIFGRGKSSGSGSSTVYISLTSSGGYRLRGMTRNSSDVAVVSQTDYLVVADIWYHIAFTYNGTEQILYINGVEVDRDAQTGNLKDLNPSQYPVMIGSGKEISTLYNPFNGTIDDVMIFNRSLSDEEILEIYNAQQHLCAGIKCSDYINSDNCINSQCGVSLGCSWDGNNCLKAVSDTWYVRPAGGSYGSENGTSYDYAWDGLKSVVWGAGGVEAGDTLYICGLHLRTRTGGSAWETFTPGANGISENARITIRGDCPASDQGVIWGAGIMAHEPWVNEGDNVWSITDVGTPNGVWYFEDITASSWTVLDKVNNLAELQATPGSYYGSYIFGEKFYVHTSDSGNPTNRIAANRLGYNLYVSNNHYITWKNLEFYSIQRWVPYESYVTYMRWENITSWYGELLLFRFRTYSHHIEFINCDLAWGVNGIGFDVTPYLSPDQPHDYIIRGCKIHDIGVRVGDSDAHAISIQGSHNALIENNEIYNVGSGITAYVGGGQSIYNYTIRWNWIHDTHTNGGANSRGIEFNAGAHGEDDTSGNKIYGNIVGPGISCVGDPGCDLKAGVCYRWNLEDGGEFYNNIAYDCDTSFYILHPNQNIQVELKNIISLNPTSEHIRFASDGTENEYSIDSDYNLFWPISGEQFFFWEYALSGGGPDGGTKTFAEWQALSRTDSTFDYNSIAADPLFVDPDNGDFHLLPGSPAIDAGIDVGLTLDYEGNLIPQGSGPDIGAYEYGPPPARISQTDEKINNLASVLSSIQSAVQDILKRIQELF